MVSINIYLEFRQAWELSSDPLFSEEVRLYIFISISDGNKKFRGEKNIHNFFFFSVKVKIIYIRLLSEPIQILEVLAVNQLFSLPCSKLSVAHVLCTRCITMCIANLFRYHSRHTRWSISSVAKVVSHGDVFEEIGIQNKWKWEWLSKVVKVGETKEHISQNCAWNWNCKMPCLFQRCCI